jgi:hypothetical protein
MGGNHFQHRHRWLWIPGSRQVARPGMTAEGGIPGPRSAPPGMTAEGKFLSADASPHPDPLPEAGRGRRGAAACAIPGHIAADSRWRYLSPQRGEKSDCEAIRVRGKAHRGIHNHEIAFGRDGRQSFSTSKSAVMDSGLAPSGAPRNDGGRIQGPRFRAPRNDGGVSIPFSRRFPSPRPSPRSGEREKGSSRVCYSGSYCC